MANVQQQPEVEAKVQPETDEGEKSQMDDLQMNGMRRNNAQPE